MIEGILWVVFILACLLVSAVILLQDPKGGGLGEAFGGAGQQAFGVDNRGIAKFTAYVSVVVILIAVAITKIRTDDSVIVEFAAPPMESPDSIPPVAEPGPGSEPPAGTPAGGTPATTPPGAPATTPPTTPPTTPEPKGDDGGGH